MEMRALKYFSVFLIIVVSALLYLIFAKPNEQGGGQPALVTHSETNASTSETIATTTSSASKLNLDSFNGLDKESKSIDTLEGLLN